MIFSGKINKIINSMKEIQTDVLTSKSDINVVKVKIDNIEIELEKYRCDILKRLIVIENPFKFKVGEKVTFEDRQYLVAKDTLIESGSKFYHIVRTGEIFHNVPEESIEKYID